MNIEVFLMEAEIAQEFADSIEARDLPEKFFYLFPRSVRAWLELSQNSITSGLRRCWEQLVDTKGPQIAGNPDSPLSVISFGSGDGAKDRMLIKSLERTGATVKYFPVDASQAMLEMACAGADDEDIETVGIKADISSPVHLVYAADAAEPPRIFIMSGNTMGSFDPLAEIRYVAQCMKPEDRLIIDGEIFDSEKSMARRDNPSARKFVSALLASVGIEEDEGDIGFTLKRDDRHTGLHLITRYFRVERDLSATVAGQEISIERGERIGLNFQYAYTPDAFRWLVTQQGGLEVLEEYASPDGRFLTFVCKK